MFFQYFFIIFLLDIIAEKMEGATSEPNLGIIKNDNNDDFENNKENVAPDDQFDDKNIK